MRMKKMYFLLAMMAGLFVPQGISAQEPADEGSMSRSENSRLSVGGYGEAAFSRRFYSDNQYRYKNWSQYANDPSNGQFDIPHAVLYLGYDFGSGWTFGTEIEFEHTGTGVATEIEADEGGEYEKEVEKGGEVALEQWWLNKRFASWANIRVGHIIVPVGLNNAHHEPLNFFTVYRPEGENTILPSTWHDTGVSLWGTSGDFRYELLMVAGLNALQYSRDGWIHNGAGSAFEFKPANKYGYAFRLDNYSVKGLRMAISGYYGQGMHNNYPNEMEGAGKMYSGVKAHTAVGCFDFTYKGYGWIARGQADYGYVSDTPLLNIVKANMQKHSNANVSKVGRNAVATGLEAGYDVFRLLEGTRSKGKKLYVFGRYEYYNSYIPEETQTKYEYTGRHVMTAGINYLPLPQIVVKAEYSYRNLKEPYNDEPSINIGVAYQGFFR
ncbi:MAG: hypothetical protein J5698_01865 [Bacteroidaceae bacterium]|nr:hypothetical protein [Bacteroidaceae bacterium]